MRVLLVKVHSDPCAQSVAGVVRAAVLVKKEHGDGHEAVGFGVVCWTALASDKSKGGDVAYSGGDPLSVGGW